MISIDTYIKRASVLFDTKPAETPWNLAVRLDKIVGERLRALGPDYKIFNKVAIHKTVRIDSHVILKGPAIISANCFIGAHAYLRGGVFLDEKVSIGPGCEIKSSVLFANSALAHFNFIGDSILGSHVNLEAGAVIANHYNERVDKTILSLINGEIFPTGVEKFGAMVGDHCKIGANAVLSPGTILKPNSIVNRLELIDQTGKHEN